MKITLELDADQIGILLGQIESMFDFRHPDRAHKYAVEIERIATRVAGGDGDFDYAVLKMAPVYAALLPHYDLEKYHNMDHYGAGDVFEFVEAVRAARATFPLSEKLRGAL
jgi:hypothetical protein